MKFKLLRGGSWLSNPVFCRSAFRFYYPREVRFNYDGFRLTIKEKNEA